MQIQTFSRKVFTVEAVQVTRDNMEEVAAWCGGEIQEKTRTGKGKAEKFVKVHVSKPINEKQTEAYLTDWVSKSPTGWKVYTNRAFVHTFSAEEPPVGNVFEHSAVVEEPVELDKDDADRIVAEVDAKLPPETSKQKRQIAIGEAAQQLKAERAVNV